MGFLDILFLGITSTILLISLVLLVFGLKSTDDKVKQLSYKKTFTPVIVLCLMGIGLYALAVSLGKIEI